MAERPGETSTVAYDMGDHARWTGVALVAGLFIIILAALYGTILRDLVWQWWEDDNYSHGFLVPPFSAFLIWQRRRELVSLAPAGSWTGLPVLAAGVGALLLGDIGGENFLMRSSLIIILAGLVLFHLGTPVFRRVAFPIAFLFFMVPLPAILFYAVAFPLQNIAAQSAAWTLDVLGVPVLLDGNVIQLSQISLGVTEACSGIRSLISLLTMAIAWAYLTLPGVWGVIGLAIAAVPITVVANMGRVVATGLIAEWIGLEYARGFFHLVSGWVIFLAAFAALLAVHGLIRLWSRRSAA